MFIDNPDTTKSCIAGSGCHDDSNSARSSMHLKTVAPIDFNANYRTVSRQLNCSNPPESPLVTYPMNVLPHPVTLFTASSPEVTNVFLPWFDL